MGTFLVSFVVIAVVVFIMAIGVIFGRRAMRGSCGGPGAADCVCVEKCDKRKKFEEEQAAAAREKQAGHG
jgi:hypothetical protein